MFDFLLHLGLFAIGAYVAFWGLILAGSMLLGVCAVVLDGAAWIFRRLRGRA